MMTAIDRLLIFSYVKSYFVCLISLLGLYIVVDLFNNIDIFAADGKPLLAVLVHIGKYYGCTSTFIFDRLSEAIVLLAAMFTVAWVQRNNELLPLLSAGVSTRRMLRPVLLSAFALVTVNIANQEFVIPRVGNISQLRDDPKGEKDLPVTGAYEPNGIQISGQCATRANMCVRNLHVVIPDSVLHGSLQYLRAKEARYIPEQSGWLLTQTDPPELPSGTHLDELEMRDPGQYFLKTTDVDFDVLTRDKKWFYQVSTWRLFQELGRSDSTCLASMAVFFHMRLTRPLLGMVLVLMGLSVILRDQNRNIFISAGLCLVLCAVFFGGCFFAKYLGDKEIFDPALAAWLPVFVFGPLSFALFDAVHT